MPARPIFVHGAGGGVETWERQEPRFEGCWTLALPGHPMGEALSTVGGYAEWVGHLLQEIPGPRVLVGHSMGGAIALQVALNEPELLDGVVIVASGPRLPVPEAALAGAREDAAAEAERLLRKGWPGLAGDAMRAEAARIAGVGGDVLARDYAACSAFDITDRLAEIALPALIVSGTEDRLAPPWLSDELAAGIPGARLQHIAGAGHWPMKDSAREFDLLVAGFLAELEVAGG